MTPSSADIAALYRATAKPRMVEVPDLTFVQIDGHGDPNTSPAYTEALQALYALSYAMRFALKRSGGADYKVAPLEGLWWSVDMRSFQIADRASWDWTMMIRQPPEVTQELFAATRAQLSITKGIASAGQARLETLAEGLAAQVLHVGPYSSEGPTIAGLHAYVQAQGPSFIGNDQKHHEIYLSDPRRTAPERLRTIIRQPVTSRMSIP
jgi:hypothetical protein